MRVWLVTIGEPVPVDNSKKDRLHRTGYLAHYLAARDHKVVWWTSTFDHFRKQHLFDVDTNIQPSSNLTIRLLHGCGYSSNISISRIKDQRQIAKKFSLLSEESAELPDIILAALPTIELCDACVDFGKRRGIPVVLDMRDMWPDIFVSHAPRPAQPAARFLLNPMFKQAAKGCSQAAAITGITDAFVEWGLKRGNRTRGPLDRAFYMGYNTQAPTPDEIREAEDFWDAQGIRAGEVFTACFIGTIGHQFDLETVISGAKELSARGKQTRFVLCGSGDQIDYYKQLAADEPSIVFPGWINSAQIFVLMRRASIGIDPMVDRYDFLATINNKAAEYMSASLPIVSSPRKGMLFELLKSKNIGASYDNGNGEGLADVLSELIDNPELLATMSANSRDLFESTFRAEKVYGDMMDYLQEVAGV